MWQLLLEQIIMIAHYRIKKKDFLVKIEIEFIEIYMFFNKRKNLS